MSLRQQGKVKWWNQEKGFGFIIPDTGKDDLFVHFKDVLLNEEETKIDNDKKNLKGKKFKFIALAKGQRVSYLVELKAKGPRAIGVKLL